MKVDLSDIKGDLPDADALLDLMGQDKKVVDGQLRFILARGIGTAFVTADVPKDAVLTLLQDALAQRANASYSCKYLGVRGSAPVRHLNF